jgi:hypothetical protein
MGMFGERDLTFSEVRERVSSGFLHVAPVPDHAEVCRNLVSMANFLPILLPTLRAREPRTICEIGAYRGISTRALIALARELGATLHVVDPSAQFLTRVGEDPGIVHHQMLSEQYLSTPREVDILLIDGDHNYSVVSRELALLQEHRNAGEAPLLLMHDVGWPCGFRDMYYDTSRVDAVRPLSEKSELTLLDGPDFDISLPSEIPFAAQEGGERNGVLRALEDFVSANPRWSTVLIPSIFGAAVVFDRESCRPAVLQELDKLKASLETFRPFLATLELNRLLLLSEIEKQGRVWHKNQEVIKRLKSGKGALKQVARRLLARVTGE